MTVHFGKYMCHRRSSPWKMENRVLGAIFYTQLCYLLYVQCLDFSGTEFILAFCEHKTGRSQPMLTIINKGSVPTNVVVSLPAISQPTTNIRTVVATSRTLYLPESLIQTYTSKRSLAIVVTSQRDIYVQGFNAARLSVGGFLVLPVAHLGTEYMVVTLCETNVCLIMIVASEDETDVTVSFHSEVFCGVKFQNVEYNSGSSLHLSLEKHDTLQLQCSGDLSGTLIRSNKRVAVFAGSDVTTIDYYTNKIGEDNIIEQMPPTEYLGNFYVLPVFPNLPSTYQAKILSIESNNTVYINKVPYTLSRSLPKIFKLFPQEFYTVVSESKILVTVLINNWGYYRLPNNTIDGSMVIIYPVDEGQRFTSLGHRMRMRFEVPGGKVGLDDIWFLLVTDKSCDSNESVVHIKDETSGFGLQAFRYKTLIENNIDVEMAGLDGCPVFSGTLWMRGLKTGCMLPWPGSYTQIASKPPEMENGHGNCKTWQRLLMFLQRRLSASQAFASVRRFLNSCCA